VKNKILQYKTTYLWRSWSVHVFNEWSHSVSEIAHAFQTTEVKVKPDDTALSLTY